MNLKDQMIIDLDVFFNIDEFSDLIDWDNDQVIAQVWDVESGQADYEELGAGYEQKVVCVKQADINQKPAARDEIRLNTDPSKVDGGHYWVVRRVLSAHGIYKIYFYRSIS